jgi:hypothetical protein
MKKLMKVDGPLLESQAGGFTALIEKLVRYLFRMTKNSNKNLSKNPAKRTNYNFNGEFMIIKHYSNNRKLYNTETAKYINLTDVINYLKNGLDIQVINEPSGENVTDTILKSCLSRVNLTTEILKQLIMVG